MLPIVFRPPCRRRRYGYFSPDGHDACAAAPPLPDAMPLTSLAAAAMMLRAMYHAGGVAILRADASHAARASAATRDAARDSVRF